MYNFDIPVIIDKRDPTDLIYRKGPHLRLWLIEQPSESPLVELFRAFPGSKVNAIKSVYIPRIYLIIR